MTGYTKSFGVDFFINNIPVDLKVTYFPNEYLQLKLKTLYGKSEISWLKSKAREFSITFDKKQKDTQIYYEIEEKNVRI